VQLIVGVACCGAFFSLAPSALWDLRVGPIDPTVLICLPSFHFEIFILFFKTNLLSHLFLLLIFFAFIPTIIYKNS